MFSLIYVGSWPCGGLWRSTSNQILRITDNHWNLALGRLGASEVTLERANVCQLEPRVGQQGYGRENIEAIDKVIGSATRHRTPLRRGHGI